MSKKENSNEIALKKKENKENKDKRLANLKPFKKGQSGNPKGKDKGVLNLTTILRKLLEEEVIVTNKKGEIILDNNGKELKIPRSQWVMMSLLEKAALYKDVTAIALILDRIDGKVTQGMELTGKDGGPIQTEDIDYSRIPLAKRIEMLKLLEEAKLKREPSK